jgi:hypothetical protein
MQDMSTKQILFFLLERPNLFAICNNNSANGVKGEGCLVEKYSVALLLVRGSETSGDSGE